MSRTVRSMVTAVVASLALVAAAGAAPTKAAKTHSVVGTIQMYDAAAKTLTVATAKGPETVTVGDSTHVMSGSKMLSAGDLSSRTGTRVKIAYTEANGQKMAQNVRIAAAPAKAASAAPKAHKAAKK